MKILVTGGLGNIGTMLLDELLRRGHQVTAFDLRTPTNEEVARRYGRRIETIWGDICDADALKPHVEGKDAVVHFAGLVPPTTEDKPELAERVNVQGTRTVLDVISASTAPISSRASSMTSSKVGNTGDFSTACMRVA